MPCSTLHPHQRPRPVVTMNIYFCSAVLALLCLSVESKSSAPKVQVYSDKPAEYGMSNTLICLVKDFHPPEITIELLRNGVKIAKTNQTDLSFDKTWHFHLSTFAEIKPVKGEHYACRVTHVGTPRVHEWELNM